jgi:Ni/Co efflux regulator RcnB
VRFDRRGNPGGWTQTRGTWRGANPDWHGGALWSRGGHDWWRARPEFHGFYGRRDGFWFIPGIGYWAVPRAYWGHHWGYGEYLPNVFWQYQVADYWDYGLPPPPYGCAWVWVDGGIALIDLSDGYIMDVQYGLW